jgi:hypothetical protein
MSPQAMLVREYAVQNLPPSFHDRLRAADNEDFVS